MWLLNSETSRIFREIRHDISAEQRERFELLSRSSKVNSFSEIVGSTGEIMIEGTLSNCPSFLSWILGYENLTYRSLRETLLSFSENDRVKSIVLRVGSSPGGTLDGLFETVLAISSVKKPITSVVHDMADSATYALISQTDRIVATNAAARFGSIGIATRFTDYPEYVDICNSASPKKRPDVRTEEGKNIVREELDSIHEIFIGAIAKGRGTTVEDVDLNFGRGAELVAEEALKRKMIDAIEPELILTNKILRREVMSDADLTVSKLKSQYSELYNTVFQNGVNAERDRVCAHLVMGESCQSLSESLKAIREGTEMTSTMTATYQAASLKAGLVKSRENDENDLKGVDGLELSGENDDVSAINILEEKFGISK